MLSFSAHCDELWLGSGYNFDRMDDNYVDRYAGCCQMALGSLPGHSCCPVFAAQYDSAAFSFSF